VRAAYRILGFESATKGDNVFRELVLARIIERTSKIDAERVLGEVGAALASYATVKRRLPSYAKPSWRQALARCAPATFSNVSRTEQRLSKAELRSSAASTSSVRLAGWPWAASVRAADRISAV
jgi:hypothetical protein